MRTNTLVTGGAGFIGSNFIRFILKNSNQSSIVNLDALTYAGNLENLRDIEDDPRYTFIYGDILDADLIQTILIEHSIDTIVHFAAESHVDRSILGPKQFIETNIVGTYTLLEESKEFWLSRGNGQFGDVRFHHVSTDEVYGTLSPTDPPFSETTPYAPNSPYAASKAASDHLVRAYFHTYGMPITISNCSNNYGPYQFPEKLIPLIIHNASNGFELPIYGDGMQIRDWLYVEDHCGAILRILEGGKIGETYNIGGNNQPTNITIVKAICEILDELEPKSKFTPHSQLITYVKDRLGHDRRYAIDTSKINYELNWEPKQNLDSGLLKTVEWYRANKDWIEKINAESDLSTWVEKNYDGRNAE